MLIRLRNGSCHVRQSLWKFLVKTKLTPFRVLTQLLVPRGRLNWQLHFGEPPKWAPGAKFILVDLAPTERDAAKAAVALRGDAAAVAGQLKEALALGDPQRWAAWRRELTEKVQELAV